MDPVNEYNKGLESFEMHYSPKADELFTIILQICRFLKEFSDFETKATPEFRHPYIKGKVTQQKLGYTPNDANASVDSDGEGLLSLFKKAAATVIPGEGSNIISAFKEDAVEVSDRDDDEDEPGLDAKKVSYLEDIGLLGELKKMNMTEETTGKVITGHEKYNVDVLSGQKKFMAYFEELINDKKIKKNHNKDPGAVTHPDFEIEEDVEDDDKVHKDGKLFSLTVKTEKGKQESISQAVIDNIDLTIEPETPPKFYYYRRWLWMIFPWVCMSVKKKQTYSDLINKCYSSNIRYLSVDEERMFTKHAIKIVMETKQKRKQMYAKKEDEGNSPSQLTKSMQNVQRGSPKLPNLKKGLEASMVSTR